MSLRKHVLEPCVFSGQHRFNLMMESVIVNRLGSIGPAGG